MKAIKKMSVPNCITQTLYCCFLILSSIFFSMRALKHGFYIIFWTTVQIHFHCILALTQIHILIVINYHESKQIKPNHLRNYGILLISEVKSIIVQDIIVVLSSTCHFHKRFTFIFINHPLQLENGNLLLDIDENLGRVTQVSWFSIEVD